MIDPIDPRSASTKASARGSLRPMLAAGFVFGCLAIGLGGCAGIGDGFASSAFVDPAKYDLYDCKQLEAERKSQESRAVDLQKLIDKAGTGAGGTAVGEMVYRSDYINARAQYKLADENFRRNNCVATPPAAPAATPPAAPATPPAKKKRG